MINSKLTKASLAASLGGLLFGFDTAVISGAEQAIKNVYQVDGFLHGFTMAIALIGTVFGAMLAGKPGDKYGRRDTMIILAVFYIVSAIGSGLANNWYMFLFYRFLGGLGVGASSVLGPMYISEISPAHLRGRLVALFQFNVVFGIMAAFFSNYIIFELIKHEAWRWMLAIEAVPAMVFFTLLFFIPRSPRWLVKKNRNSEAREILEKLGNNNSERVLAEIEESLKEEKAGQKERLFTRKYSLPITLAVLLATFNQFTGINAILYYAPRIFGMAGLASDSAMLQSVSIGFTNVVFTVLAMVFIDKFGRKTLLTIGSVGMVVFLSLTAFTMNRGVQDGYAIVFYLIGFCAFFAFSQGAVIWVFISEIFPNAVRAKGQSLGSLTHWFWAAVITWVFPKVAETPKGGVYAFMFFAAAMVVHLIFAAKFLPETKGKSLEELQKEILNK